MKVEVCMGDGGWSEEDKAMGAAVLGTRGFDYLISSSVSAECSLMSVGSDENFQNKLAFPMASRYISLPTNYVKLQFSCNYKGCIELDS